MGDYSKNLEIKEKRFKFQKIICLCILAWLISMTVGIHKVFAATDTQTISGVTFTVTTDKDNYALGEPANVTFVIQNSNPYDVDVSEFEFKLPEWMQLKKDFLNQTVPAEQTVTLNTTIDFTFEDWKTVELNGQKINVGVRALYDTIEPGSTLQVQVIKKDSPEYNSYWNNLDNKNEFKRVEFLDISVRQKNGTMYSDLIRPATIYIEVPENWNENELQAIYASAGVDEQFKENFITIDGVRYLCFDTSHFSPYLIADSFTPSSLKTGDGIFKKCCVAASTIVCLLMMAFAHIKKSVAICFIILATQFFSVAGINNISAVDNLGENSAQSTNAVNFKISISDLILDFKMMIFGKHEYKVPKNITVTIKHNILEVKMGSVPNGWKGKIIFEDKAGYDNYQQNFGKKNMHYSRGLYKYIMPTDNLPNGTYDIKIYDNSDKLLFVKNNVVLS